jgi:hypothetical protein
MKTCNTCSVEKLESDFYRQKDSPDRLQYRCKNCTKAASEKTRLANPEKHREYRKTFRRLHPTRLREFQWRLQGIRLTYPEYIELKTIQQNRCAICREHESNLNRPLFVDHDHHTKEVRGLLCDRCNRGLGFFKDNTYNLSNAVKYLSNFGD